MQTIPFFIPIGDENNIVETIAKDSNRYAFTDWFRKVRFSACSLLTKREITHLIGD